MKNRMLLFRFTLDSTINREHRLVFQNGKEEMDSEYQEFEPERIGPRMPEKKKSAEEQLFDLRLSYTVKYDDTKRGIEINKKKGGHFAEIASAAESALKQHDPKKVKELKDINVLRTKLAQLTAILEAAGKDVVEKARKKALERISRLNKENKKRFSELVRRNKESFADYPETLKAVSVREQNYLAQIDTLYNTNAVEIERKYHAFLSSLPGNREKDMDGALGLIEKLSKEDDLQKATDEITESYKREIKGSFCLEMAKSKEFERRYGELLDAMNVSLYKERDEMLAELSKIKDRVNINSSDEEKLALDHEILDLRLRTALNENFRRRVEALRGKFARNTKGVPESAYKPRAVLVAQAMDELYALRREIEPKNNALKEHRGYKVATIEGVGKMREWNEKGWPKASETLQAAGRKELAGEYALNKGVNMHYGPEDKDLNGLVRGVINAGTRVKGIGKEIKVKSDVYVLVQVIDKKGIPGATGWVSRNALTPLAGGEEEKSETGGDFVM